MTLRHGGLVAVDDVDLATEPGRITAVVGPNGAGKTTLFDCLSGVQRPDAGRVVLDGLDVTAAPADERSRLGLLRTFQRSSVFASLTVRENLLVGAENRRSRGNLRGFLGLSDRGGAGHRRRAEQALSALALEAVGDVTAATLSTGSLRLVELARALAADPVVLLLDEPASGLDDHEVDELRHLLVRLAGEGLTLLLVEHDMDLVSQVADTVYVMAAGRILAAGPPEEVLARPDVRLSLLGPRE